MSCKVSRNVTDLKKKFLLQILFTFDDVETRFMKVIPVIILCLYSFLCSGQQPDSTEVDTIEQVIVQGYYQPNQLLQTTSSVSIVDSAVLQIGTRGTMLEPLNAVPGVRMEQRSPGSYRLSMRGSLLRSPYGVRNVKVYLNDFSLTGAGGNTYLNLLDKEAIQKIEVFKGPHSSQYGVNTGGTLLLNTSKKEEIQATLNSGSYGYLHPTATIHKQLGSHQLTVHSAYQKSDGYRSQSAMDRTFVLLNDTWKIHSSLGLNAFGFFSDLHYETPGGLTLEQMNEDRTQARQATSFAPGSVEQQAGIFNTTFFGGLSANWDVEPWLTNITAIHGVHTDLKNPFVTNFEERNEKELGIRTQFRAEKTLHETTLHSFIGYEAAVRQTTIRNFDNESGEKGAPQRFDDIDIMNQFAFAGVTADIEERLFIEASASLNFLTYDFYTQFPEQRSQDVQFDSELMPNFGASYTILPNISIRANVSKGFSPPTTEEIRPSTQQIYPNLHAESGWNKELGIRYNNLFNRFNAELTTFNFHLENTIIRRENNQGEEFFVNTGGTKQKGWELFIRSFPIDINDFFLNNIQVDAGATAYNFEFADFTGTESNLNGNDLTGVPGNTLHVATNLQFPGTLKAIYTHYYTSAIPLNDENTVVADDYHSANLSLQLPIRISNHHINVTGLINNLYDERYSLGFDINAFGERYYNPANERNYGLGVSWQFD